jgi:hypothetical protein
MDQILDFLQNNLFASWVSLIIIAFGCVIFIIQFVKGGQIEVFGLKFNINNKKMEPEVLKIQYLDSRKQNMNYLRDLFSKAQQSIDCVFVTGGFISPVLLQSLIQDHPRLAITFYLVKPNSQSHRMRLKHTKDKFPVGAPDDGYAHIIDAAKKYNNVKLFYYKDYPFWHYVKADNAKIAVSYNPLRKIGFDTSPLIIINNEVDVQQLYDMHKAHIELIINQAEPFVG